MSAFKDMSETSRVWVFAANRKLNSEEQQSIQADADLFTKQWTAHEKQLKAEFTILHNVFFVLMVDETFNEVSGCGIDKSTAFVKSMENKYQLNLFNRMQIEILSEDGLIITTKQEAETLLDKGLINAESITFNKMITTKEAFDQAFSIPLKKSWFYSQFKSVSST